MSVYFWALYSVPLIHVSIFVPISCSFDYYSLVVLFELSAVDLCFPKSSTVIGTGRYVEICFLTKPNFKLQLDVTAGPQNWKVSVFIPIPKRSSANECSYYYTIVLISHSSKVILKILQASLQQYVNWELPGVKTGFRKGSGTRDQNCQHLLDHREGKGIPEKRLLLLHWLKPLTAWITTNCG